MQTNNTNKNNQGLNLIDIFFYLLSKWKWFLLSVLICGGVAWYIYAKTPKIYFQKATVIIKDPSNKTSSAGLDRYDNFINKVNVANEIYQFRSKKLMAEVVKRVKADVSYQCKDGLRDNELYTQSPISVTFLDITPGAYSAFTATPRNKNSVTISDINGLEETTRIVALNDTIQIPNGRVVITPTNYYNDSWIDVPIRVQKLPIKSTVGYYLSNLGIRQEEDEASILTLSMKDSSPIRAEDMLNMLITVYNEEAINDKNQVAINTADFINDRLIIIESELGGVESDLESFKKENKIVNISSAAGMYMSESQKYNENALELETQLRLAKYIKEYLTDPSKDTYLIPANTGINDMNIETQINQYNNAKLKRDKLIDDSSDKNPIVEELNNSLRAMKQTIIRAVDNMIVSLNVRKDDAQSHEMRAQARVTSIPTKERQMLSIERQQKIKEALYLFLLNRREENALSQAMADNNARVIDSAEGSYWPISPNRNRILALGIIIGLAIPGIIFLLILFFDTRIHSRKDLEGAINVPFLGEIPIDKELMSKKNKHKTEVVVSDSRDDMISEAFRILRTNMAFMGKKDKRLQVITFTSFNEGAGKTFISRNLTMSFVQTKKKIVLVDLDIRKGTLSSLLKKDKKGVTNYLADPSVSVDDIIQHDDNFDNFDIITAGVIAPNPAELLMDERLDQLIEELRERYDYIIVDNVPVGIIADSTIANRIADLTVFVVRAGKLDRRQLVDIENLYTSKKLNNMALVLNGTNPKRHGYGYGYGYGYRYGYGYGYGYGSNKKKKR